MHYHCRICIMVLVYGVIVVIVANQVGAQQIDTGDTCTVTISVGWCVNLFATPIRLLAAPFFRDFQTDFCTLNITLPIAVLSGQMYAIKLWINSMLYQWYSRMKRYRDTERISFRERVGHTYVFSTKNAIASMSVAQSWYDLRYGAVESNDMTIVCNHGPHW